MLNRFRSMPATAMAAVLGCALMTIAAPVAAKEKAGKEQDAKKSTATVIPVSKEFAPLVKKMTDAQKAKDAAALQTALAAAEGKPTTDGDRYWLYYYTLELGIMNKDKAVQQRALDGLLDSGLTPPVNLGVYNFFSGRFAYNDKDYAKAVKRLEAAKTAGSDDPSLPSLLMDSYLNLGQIDQGVGVAKAAIEADRAAGKTPPEDLFVRPARALQSANRMGDMIDVLTLRLRDYGDPSIWRNTLYIVLQQEGTDKEANLDTLRLMRATHSMKERPEYLEYAALATESGYPGEVVALIKEGQNANVINKTDERFNSILESQEPRAKADLPTLIADAAKPATRANGKVARQTADGLAGVGKFDVAIPLYEAAAAAGDPLAQYRLAVAQALAGQKDAALASFGKVQGNRQRLAQLWVVHLTAVPKPAAAPAPAPAPAS